MTPVIIPFLRPEINWLDFIKNAEVALGYNPIRAAEKRHGRPLSNAAKLIVTLAAFKDKEATDGLASLRGADRLLRTLYYGFEIASPTEAVHDILESTDLDILRSNAVNGMSVAIVSGRLDQWKRAIIELTAADNIYAVRYIFSWIMIYFEREGLGEVFSNVSKTLLQDHTLRLESK